MYSIHLDFTQTKLSIHLREVMSHVDWTNENGQAIPELLMTLNQDGQMSNAQLINVDDYGQILVAYLPLVLAHINGTGYAYEDLEYSIECHESECHEGAKVTGNCHDAYDQFALYNQCTSSSYRYPSRDVDLFIFNGEIALSDRTECLLVFGIKKNVMESSIKDSIK